jgi:hypothetical protein
MFANPPELLPRSPKAILLRLLFVSLSIIVTMPAFPQSAAGPGKSVRMVVTLEPRRGKEIPLVEQQDVNVFEDQQKRPVTAFAPDEGSLQILLLIDDSAGNSFNTEIPSLKQFVNSLPAQAEVAVGYMHNGLTQLGCKFTSDHNAAASAIRMPLGPGGADVDPYGSLAYAIKHWPEQHAERREVVMVSSGIEGLGGGFYPQNPYVLAGINDAQKAGLVVYAIWSPGVGHFGHDYWLQLWGENFLGELSDATGGEMYWTTIGPPVSFDPYLQDILNHLQHQFLLSFAAIPDRAGLQPVRVAISGKDASVAFPRAVYVGK